MRKGRPRNNPREREICVPLCLIHFLNNVKNTIHVVSEEIQHALCQRDYVKKLKGNYDDAQESLRC